jgi:hypothetical protein
MKSPNRCLLTALGDGMAHAFRSDKTPAFGGMVGRLFGDDNCFAWVTARARPVRHRLGRHPKKAQGA